MGPEVEGVGEIGLARGDAGGVAHDVAIGIEPENIAAHRGRERLVEKDLLAQVGGDLQQFGMLHGPDQPAQGLVVKFDVAQDVAFDQLDDIAGGADGRLLDTLALAPQQITDDAHDSEHGDATAQIEDQLGVRPVECETR
ncbi:hypothetical protein D3C73_1195640 [compost metagenome]